MLKKLLKYEFKATGRVIFPLYIALILVSLINKIFVSIKPAFGFNLISERLENVIAIISMIIYGSIMIAIFIVTLFIIIQRYYKNLLGDEGYLMNTLPVEVWKNIFSKLVVAISWSVISIIVAIISIFILAYHPGIYIEIFNTIRYLLTEVIYNLGINTPLIILEFLILGILSITSSILLIYASISIGHLSNKRKKSLSFLSYIVINVITYFIQSLLYQLVLYSILIVEFQIYVNLYLIISIIGLIITSVIYFLISKYCMEKKLNLE